MSYSCTLHPVDSRVVRSLIAAMTEGRADWSYLKRLWLKKQLINRVNQPFKQGLKELLTDCPEFNLEIHLWGRPFFIYGEQPEEVSRKINVLYGMTNVRAIKDFYLGQLRQFSETAYQERASWEIPKLKETDLGLEVILANLRSAYKHQKYEYLGEEIGFILAQLNGAAYPYWQLDNFGLTFLEQLPLPGWEQSPNGLRELFSELPQIKEYLPVSLNRNLAAGIYLDQSEVSELLELLDRYYDSLLSLMGQKQLPESTAQIMIQKTKEALVYAKDHGYGLLEATDIIETETIRYP